MISLLSGTVIEIELSTVTVDVNGVGYQVHCSRPCLEAMTIDSEVRIVIFTEVKEDSIRLYGFADKLEKQVFTLLTLVKGVGAKSALDIISKVDKLELLRVISLQDIGRLQAVKGIGRKTAERIVVELKDKVSEFAMEQSSGPLIVRRELDEPAEDAVRALQALGFSKKDAERAVTQVGSGILAESTDPGAIVKEALRFV